MSFWKNNHIKVRTYIIWSITFFKLCICISKFKPVFIGFSIIDILYKIILCPCGGIAELEKACPGHCKISLLMSLFSTHWIPVTKSTPFTPNYGSQKDFMVDNKLRGKNTFQLSIITGQMFNKHVSICLYLY